MILKIPSEFYVNLANELHTLSLILQMGNFNGPSYVFPYKGIIFIRDLIFIIDQHFWDEYFVMKTVECHFLQSFYTIIYLPRRQRPQVLEFFEQGSTDIKFFDNGKTTVV